MKITKKYTKKRDEIMELIKFHNIPDVIAFNLANDIMKRYFSDIPQYEV